MLVKSLSNLLRDKTINSKVSNKMYYRSKIWLIIPLRRRHIISLKLGDVARLNDLHRVACRK